LRPEYLKKYQDCFAVMKCYGLYWDTSLPRVIKAMEYFNIMIEPRMTYFEVRFYKKVIRK
jgi:hypothetical protein